MLDPLVASKLMTAAITKRANLIEETFDVVTFEKEDGYIVLDESRLPKILSSDIHTSHGELVGADGDFLLSNNGTYYHIPLLLKFNKLDIEDLVLIGDEDTLLSLYPEAILDVNLTGSADWEPSENTFPNDFAVAYNTYVLDGIVLGALNTGGDISILETALTGDTETSISELALAFAGFWATVAIAPGIPAHGGTAVVSVTNNAASLVGLFENAITASLTNVASKPYYNKFVSNIESIAVSNIIWVVTEMVGGPPAPVAFPEGIA